MMKGGRLLYMPERRSVVMLGQIVLCHKAPLPLTYQISGYRNIVDHNHSLTSQVQRYDGTSRGMISMVVSPSEDGDTHPTLI